ncbi:hypothetical protein D3C86_1266310 [compost metagenome]
MARMPGAVRRATPRRACWGTIWMVSPIWWAEAEASELATAVAVWVTSMTISS